MPKYYQLVSMGSGIIDGFGGSFLVILCIFQNFYHDYLFLWLAKKKRKNLKEKSLSNSYQMFYKPDFYYHNPLSHLIHFLPISLSLALGPAIPQSG